MKNPKGYATSAPKLIGNYVGGRFVTAGSRFDDVNPVDGTVHAQVVEADRDLVNEAVTAARAAVKAGWGHLAAEQRALWLRRIADSIERRFDEFVMAEVADTGKPVSLVRALDVPRGIANFRMFADLAIGFHEESYRTDTPDGR